MTKFSDSPSLPKLGKAGGRSGAGMTGTTPLQSGMGSVIRVVHNDTNRSNGLIQCSIAQGNGVLKKVLAAPVSTHNFICPLPNELVYCFKDTNTDDWFYLGPLSNGGALNHTANAKHMVYDENNEAYWGKFTKSDPESANCADIFEGDLILQSRYGATIRLSHTNKNFSTPWSVSEAELQSPIIALRTGVLPVENLEHDFSSLYLTMDQSIEVPFKTPTPDAIANNYTKAQILLYTDRVMIGTRTDDIYLSSANTIQLSTPQWNHDVDEVLDTLTELISEIKTLASEVASIAQSSMTQTFMVVSPFGGPTLPSSMMSNFGTNYSNMVSSQTALNQIEQKLQALKQK